MRREIKYYVIFIILFLILNIFNPLIVTTQTLNRYIVPFDYSVWGFLNAVFSNLAFLLTIVWLVSFIKDTKKRMLVLLIFTFALNGMLFAINIFHRYYGTAFTIKALSIFKNPTAGVGTTILFESLKELITYYRIILFIPFIALLLLVISINKKENMAFEVKIGLKGHLAHLLVVFILSISTFTVFQSQLEKTPMVDSSRTTFAAQNLGIYQYHVLELLGYDVKEAYDESKLDDVKSKLDSFNKNKSTYVNFIDGSTYTFSPQIKDAQNLTGKLIAERDESEYLTGILEGYDVVLIHLETFNHFLLEIDVLNERFKYLNELLKESYVFSNFYTNVGIGNSFDAEVSVLAGLNANGTSNIAWEYGNTNSNPYADFNFTTIPKLLKQKDSNYHLESIHGDTKVFYNRDVVHPNMFGFDAYYALEEFMEDGYTHEAFDHDAGNWVSDRALFAKMNEKITNLKSTNTPFMLFPITMMPHIPYWHDPINGTNGSNPEKDLLFSEFKGKIDEQTMRYIKYIDYYDELFYRMFVDESGEFMNHGKTAYLFYGDHGSGIANGDLDVLYGNDKLDIKMSNSELRRTLLRTIAFLYVPGDEKPEYGSTFNEGLIKGEQTLVRGQTDLYRTMIDLFNLPISSADYVYGVHGMSNEPTFSIDNKGGDVITDKFIFSLTNSNFDEINDGMTLSEAEIEYRILVLEEIRVLKEYIIEFKKYSDLAINYNLYQEFK